MKIYERYLITIDGETKLYPFDYLTFYESNIHPYTDIYLEDGIQRVYDGITAEEFYLKHKDEFEDNMQSLVFEDKRLNELQEELEKEGKQVCMLNIYILSKFLVERGKSRYIFLLKPSMGETLDALKDVSKITFTNQDGTIVESTSRILLKKVMEALETEKESKTIDFEVEKIVTWDKVSNNSVMMSCFVNDLTMFLNKYFPVKRKKDALVSTKEVELILYLMKIFNLSTVELTNKRYWHLMKTYKEVSKHENQICQIPYKNGIYVPLFFIPYSIWNKGKIDWTENEASKFTLNDGTIIGF